MSAAFISSSKMVIALWTTKSTKVSLMTSSTSTAGTGSWELRGLSCLPHVYQKANVELCIPSGWMVNIQQKMKGG